MAILFLIAVAVVLGLGLFLYRELRRPVGAHASGSARWQKRLRLAIIAVAFVIVGLFVWAFVIEPNRLIVRQETIYVANWPRELNGLRVAVISDIHIGGWAIDDSKLRLIVKRTNELQPELIVILGDYMSADGWTSNQVEPEQFAPLLKDFTAPFGVYSVLGNHDWWYDGNRVRRALESNGLKVLDNEVFEVKARGTSLWLAGLADLWTRPQRIDETIRKTPEGAMVIALAHNPDIFPRLSTRVPLLLAGHTHGGQVRFPIIGTVIQPSNFGQRYVRGHVFENNHHLFVTSGIGTSIIPVRFGVPPEIVLVTLMKQ